MVSPELTKEHLSNWDDSDYRKFWSSVKKTRGCWNWRHIKKPNQYGSFYTKGISYRAHRISVVLSGRDIPEFMVVDHMCRNRSCVNPKHLRVVTSKINILAGVGVSAQNARKTHCRNGHKFLKENTYGIKLNTTTGIGRDCRICRAMSSAKLETRRKIMRKVKKIINTTNWIEEPKSAKGQLENLVIQFWGIAKRH